MEGKGQVQRGAAGLLCVERGWRLQAVQGVEDLLEKGAFATENRLFVGDHIMLVLI